MRLGSWTVCSQWCLVLLSPKHAFLLFQKCLSSPSFSRSLDHPPSTSMITFCWGSITLSIFLIIPVSVAHTCQSSLSLSLRGCSPKGTHFHHEYFLGPVINKACVSSVGSTNVWSTNTGRSKEVSASGHL